MYFEDLSLCVEKDNVPRNCRFMLRSSRLEEALRAVAITTDVPLRQTLGPSFFSADFWPPGNVPHERSYIVSGTVDAVRVKPAREFVETSVLPAFIQWAQDLLALPLNSPVRRTKQVFCREFEGRRPRS
ncbi:hypothetical protein [Tahibacter amnicola]|uniref:Uncharacterized protein n=1 Tax=Tahibacter amnicola TaxID=2976241 RepID=A0ABY6BJS5_9GAMM|nr:hypothetical protein [Tahibacter amnicola]UXI70266.1 hypothetical protein N4264_11705 [Tahibacter amnicola]